MKKIRFAPCVSALALLTLAVACSDAPSDAAAPPAASAPTTSDRPAADQDAITQQNLLASERFWPYRVALAEPVPVAGRDAPLPAGLVGVLIRVEESGQPRIDFASNGKLEIPVGATDILARANEIRRGESQKTQPNFVQAIEARMLDSAAERLRPLPLEESIGRPGFLCVFADPDSEGFEALVRTLAPLRERAGVMTILFPQGQHTDPKLRERLRSLDWPVPFLLDHLAEPYTKTLLPEAAALPFVLLQSPEGRVLFQGQPTPGDAGFLAALDAAFDGISRSRSLADSSS